MLYCIIQLGQHTFSYNGLVPLGKKAINWTDAD